MTAYGHDSHNMIVKGHRSVVGILLNVVSMFPFMRSNAVLKS
jgi:hypothetical protein